MAQPTSCLLKFGKRGSQHRDPCRVDVPRCSNPHKGLSHRGGGHLIVSCMGHCVCYLLEFYIFDIFHFVKTNHTMLFNSARYETHINEYRRSLTSSCLYQIHVDLVLLDTVTIGGAVPPTEKLIRRFLSAPEPAVVILLSNTALNCDAFLVPVSSNTSLPEPCRECFKVGF